MASGRVGGTRSKIRGQVGNVVYQVVRNPDGTYTQISYGKPEDITQTITPRGQAQKMCTSMVEALMRDLKPVGTISMQSGVNKSKSLNAFSSFNLQLVARDCKAHWYNGQQFCYPTTSNVGEPDEQLGGLYMISSGTWQYNGFDELVHLDRPIDVWPFREFLGKRFAGMKFHLLNRPETMEAFLKRHFMSALDTVVFCCFHDWLDAEQSPEDPVHFTRNSYIIAEVNAAIGAQTLITPATLANLFNIKSDWEVFQRVSDDGQDFYIGLLIDNENDGAYFYTYGGFTISYLEGKKKISSSSFKPVENDIAGYLYDQAPADVFGTWMGAPSIKPYPSPFGPNPVPPTPPTPTPRLPEDYQEVEWVKSVSGQYILLPFRLPYRQYIAITAFKMDSFVSGFIFGAPSQSPAYGIRSSLTSANLWRIIRFKMNDINAFYVELPTSLQTEKISVEIIPKTVGYRVIANGEIFDNDSADWGSDTSDKPWSIWASNSSVQNVSIYETIIKDKDSLEIVHDLVPCYRKSDEFCGFYDLTAGSFVTADDGLGSFTYGPLVNV